MQSLYEVKSSDDGLTYFFTTKHDLKYIVALTTNDSLGVKAFYLNIYPEDEKTISPIDFWIKNTVIDIIGRILNKEENVINVMKYDYCFKTADGYKINASLLYNENNPLANYLIAQFTDLMNLF